MKLQNVLGYSVGVVAAGALLSVAVGQGFNPPPPLTPAQLEIVKKAEAAPTPHLADGKVDFSGYWRPPSANPNGQYGFGTHAPLEGNNISVFPKDASVKNVNAADAAHAAARRANTALRPKYKPEFAAKAEENFNKGDLADPTYGCTLPGVVRLGLPNEIFARGGSVTFLYEGLVNHYRVIPTDARKPDPHADPVPLGHSIGHWEGNTLVIVTTGFIGDYWLDHDGSYYSGDLKLTEKISRQGNALKFEMLAEDPMFAEPFKAYSSTLVLQPADEHIADEYGCEEKDITHMVNGAKH
jgi:hypothetical protein